MQCKEGLTVSRPMARGLYAMRLTPSRQQHSASAVSKVRHSRLRSKGIVTRDGVADRPPGAERKRRSMTQKDSSGALWTLRLPKLGHAWVSPVRILYGHWLGQVIVRLCCKHPRLRAPNCSLSFWDLGSVQGCTLCLKVAEPMRCKPAASACLAGAGHWVLGVLWNREPYLTGRPP